LGMLHISPKDFWDMSLTELHTAIDGFMEYSGNKGKTPMTTDELNELMELYPD